MLKRKSSPQTPNGGSESCSWEENLSLLEVAGSSPAARTIFICTLPPANPMCGLRFEVSPLSCTNSPDSAFEIGQTCPGSGCSGMVQARESKQSCASSPRLRSIYSSRYILTIVIRFVFREFCFRENDICIWPKLGD